MAAPFRAGWNGAAADGGAGAASGQGAAGEAASGAATAQTQEEPAWTTRLHRRQQLTHAATTTAHALRAGAGAGSGQGPSLRDSDSQGQPTILFKQPPVPYADEPQPAKPDQAARMDWD